MVINFVTGCNCIPLIVVNVDVVIFNFIVSASQCNADHTRQTVISCCR